MGNLMTFRDYAVRSKIAQHYLFLLIVLAVGILSLWGWDFAQLFGEAARNKSLEPEKVGDGYFLVWAVFTLAIFGYLFSRLSLSGNKDGNVTPVIPGLLWLAAGILSMLVIFDNFDYVSQYAQQEIANKTKSYGSEPLFALPAVALLFVTGAQVFGLFVFSLLDIREAFSGKPVIMRLPKPEPERVMAPVQPAANQTHLATRDTEALKPRFDFSALSGMEDLKAKLLDAARQWNNNGRKNGKNGILLCGPAGGGKTAFAEALAGEVGIKIIKSNIGNVASKWINQTTEQLQHLIDAALRQAPCVLFIDELDGLLPDRTRIERGDSEEVKVVSTFLASVEKLRAGKVLLIAATNYKDRVDPAAIREGRFDFHVEVAMPDFEARKGLVMNALKEAGKSVEPAVLERLSRRWAGFNVPRIQLATQRAAGFAKGAQVGMRDFMAGLRDVQGNKTGVPESAVGLADLYFDDDLKDRLVKLATTFARSDEIEARGGSVTKGVIFYGPPGTGKTTMAQALAKEAGWTFIPTSGKDILSDADKLSEIRHKASDLRPSIVFIDEADDILGDRNFSGMKLHTNDLLRTIDGAGEPLHDVVWILATNNVGSLDEAVNRRFPVKIELPVPGVGTLFKLIRDWAARRPEMVPGGPDAWAADVAAALEGLAPSVVKNILDAALNTEAANSVVRGDNAMRLTIDDVLFARREMRA